MDTEANNILKNTSSNLKLSILHETDHTKSWQTHEETGLLHHKWRMKRCKLLWESTLAISEEHENVRQIILSPLYTYIPTQIKKNCVHRLVFKWYHPNSQKSRNNTYFSQSQNRSDKANLSPNTVDSATNRKQLLSWSAMQMKDVRNRRFLLYNSSGIKHLGKGVNRKRKWVSIWVWWKSGRSAPSGYKEIWCNCCKLCKCNCWLLELLLKNHDQNSQLTVGSAWPGNTVFVRVRWVFWYF